MEKKYWETRYSDKNTQWDLGNYSTPLISFLEKVSKESKILFPGAGSGHDAEFLFKQGYSNVHILDFVEQPLVDFSNRNPNFPKDQIHQADIFSFTSSFDFIMEQTLFCAIEPKRRLEYIKAIHSLVNDSGVFAGVLFNRQFENGPPFGGDLEEYSALFNQVFSSVQFEECHNSIAPRMGSELFFIAKK